MDDDNGLELRLALPCSGSSVISKGKSGRSSDTSTAEGDRGNKMIDDFHSFLHGGSQKQESGVGSQRSNPVNPEPNPVAAPGTPSLSLMVGPKISQAETVQWKLERGKGDGKQHATEDFSSQTQDEAKGSSIRAIDRPDKSRAEESFSELSAIRPGIAGDLKFGGCGSCPNLPWVSTMGPGPNGRKISGVTYRYSATQIRIVCACHGSHMSPEEFLQHAGGE